MLKTLLCTALLFITINTLANSNTSGIDLNDVMRLLESTSQTNTKTTPDTHTKPSPAKIAEAAPAKPECKLPGKVIRVVDGDTVHVLDKDKKSHNIRLAGIDAPERGQPYSKAATKHLKTLVAGKQVCVQWYKKDKYQRLIGVVFLNNQDINLQMVEKGFAWHFKKFQKEQTPADRIKYANAEKNSRLSVIGLWQEPDPITPDDWRAGVRPGKNPKKQPQIPTAQTTPDAFNCGGNKRFCKHMQSCAEACFYLQQCGISRLDRDKDGTPCESVCTSGCPQ